MRRLVWLGVILISGCTTVQPPVNTPPPLPLLPAPVEEAPAPELPNAERELLIDSEPYWPEGNPVQVAAKAIKRATVTASALGFDRAMLVYPYRPYAVYRVDVPFRGSLHIQLQLGEEIRLVDGLRKEDWVVLRDDATTSLEASHLTVRPTATEANVRGHMILITSKMDESRQVQRVYYLDVHCQESSGLYGVSWRHPPKVAR